jgi:hypothetical protein
MEMQRYGSVEGVKEEEHMIWIRTLDGNLVYVGIIQQAVSKEAQGCYELLTVVNGEWYKLAVKLTPDQVRFLLEAANRAIRAKQPLVDFAESLRAETQGGLPLPAVMA